MAYQRQNFKSGQVLAAEQMSRIDNGIYEACGEIEKVKGTIENDLFATNEEAEEILFGGETE